MKDKVLKSKIDKLEIDPIISRKLNSNNIYTIKDLWCLQRDDLKNIDLTSAQINQIRIRMQLQGIDLNNRIYNKN